MLAVPVDEQLEQDEKQSFTPQSTEFCHYAEIYNTIPSVMYGYIRNCGCGTKLTTANEISEAAFLYKSFCMKVEGQNSVQTF